MQYEQFYLFILCSSVRWHVFSILLFLFCTVSPVISDSDLSLEVWRWNMDFTRMKSWCMKTGLGVLVLNFIFIFLEETIFMMMTQRLILLSRNIYFFFVFLRFLTWFGYFCDIYFLIKKKIKCMFSHNIMMYVMKIML